MTRDVPGGQSITSQSFIGGPATGAPNLRVKQQKKPKKGGVPVRFPLSKPSENRMIKCDICLRPKRPDKLWALCDRKARLVCKSCKDDYLAELAEIAANPPPANGRIGIGRHRNSGRL